MGVYKAGIARKRVYYNTKEKALRLLLSES